VERRWPGAASDLTEFGTYHVSIEQSTQDASEPTDWVNLVAGIRADDQTAVLRLGNIFRDGIGFFLRRGLGRHRLQSRRQEVLSLVITSIKETSLDNPNRLASHVLNILQQYIRSQTTAAHLILETDLRVNINSVRAIRKFLAKIAAVDREALRRYYVDKQSSEQICEELNFTSSRFHAVRSTFRSAARPRGGRRR
jgi:hypothetical protein